MREKIERFANGKFEYEKQILLLSETQIAFTVAADTQKPGEFVISSGSLRQLKGIVYSSTSRMKVENPSFLARTVRIYYTFDSRGMYGSQVEEGFFCLVTDAGEYRLPYRITAELPVNLEWDDYAYFVTADPIEPPSVEVVETGADREEFRVEIIEPGGEELSKEEAERLSVLAMKSRQPQPGQLLRLKHAYERYQTKEILAGIINSLIKEERTDKESFIWYRLGVEQEVKITNLYEFFIRSAPEEYPELMPKNVLLYFLYNNTLSASQKAILYANVVRYEDSSSSLYREYRRLIEPFMLDQLLQRRITDNLAVLYETFLVDSLLTIDFAEALADVMFIRRLECKDRRIKEVQVLYEPLSQRIGFPVKNGKAYIPIYTAGAKIVLVDGQGNAYATSVPYTLNRLLEEGRYIDRCRALLKYHTGLYLHLCDSIPKDRGPNKEAVELYKQVLQIEGFTESYLQSLRQEIIQYYYVNHELEELDETFFMAQADAMLPTDRAKYVEILILRGLYEQAWDLTRRFGHALIRPKILVRLAAWQIRERGYEREDYLVKLCYEVFQSHKYNESILEYLAGYYQGDLEALLAIWQAGMEFELDVFELEERILSQMLFTEQFVESAFPLFMDYERTGGHSLVSRAYLAWLSHVDFVLGQKIPEETYEYLEQAIAWETDLPDVCRLSYLRYLAGKRRLSEVQRQQAFRLGKEYLYRRLRFGFMKELMARLGSPHLLEDKSFVEYRAHPGHKVVIHYVLETPGQEICNYVAERMYPTSVGVFIKEFTLFYGERLTYFITETLEDESERTSPRQVLSGDCQEQLETGSKYAAIYEMSRSGQEGKEAKLMEQLLAYRKKQYLVEALFRLK
ncbi:MAG: hypothetical protein HFI33_02620 [Lachnospiraceae bacterium]|nr:hypothetical protein [Lachnospiraceae bacterium]